MVRVHPSLEFAILAAALALIGPESVFASIFPRTARLGRRVELAVARDTNPDPHIVEIDLTARIAAVEVAPGKVVQAWTYDGGIPAR
jgi:hypothetical protein